MPVDREAALRKAEKLLRQGKLDGAIEEYVRLIDDQPRDWNAMNALGDLYVRADDAERAVQQFTRIADFLFQEGFLPKAAALYKKALKVQPRHDHTLSQLAEIAVRQGVFVDAKTYLRQLIEQRRQRGDEAELAAAVERLRRLDDGADAQAEVAGTAAAPATSGAGEPPSLLAVARQELESGDDRQGRATLMRVLTSDPSRHPDVLQLALDLARSGQVDRAYGCVDVLTDAAVLEGNLLRAIEALQAFVEVTPSVAALNKLVELCVDADLDVPLRVAQAQLADVYLSVGQGAEARVIAEDLLAHDPTCDAHAHRLLHALELLGVENRDTVVAELRNTPQISDFAAEMAADSDTEAPETVEIDLSDVLAELEPTVQAPHDVQKRHLEQLQTGGSTEAMANLEAAASDPAARFKAAVELGRLHIRRGELEEGIAWLERAADSAATTREDGFAVLYDLADALERLGEPARALAVLIDLDADAGDYRDVRARIEHLARVQPGTHQG